MNNYPFLRKEKFGLRTQETFVGSSCEIFVPDYFFNKTNPDVALARDLGNRIETIGILWFKVDGRDWYELKLPLRFEFEFSAVEKKKLKIQPSVPEETYMVYTLKNGDAFVYDTLHKKDLDDFIKDFIGKIIENAKLPSSVKYNDVLNLFFNSIKVTEVGDIGITGVSIEMMLSEMFRNKRNIREPFRLAYNGKNMYDYKMVRLVKIPGLNSTFTSIIGEDVNNQLVSSILRKREGAIEPPSPIEKIIKY